jgi:hypothetical protein
MKDYYQYLGIRRDSNTETIKGALEMAYQKLKQVGSIDSDFMILREIEDTLLDPVKRAAYDGKLETEKPFRGERRRKETKKGLIIAAIVLSIILVTVLFFYLPGKIAGEVKPSISPGVYLISDSTGENIAVLRKFDPDHSFPDGKKGKGYEVLHLESNETEWISEEELSGKYRAGAYAPRELTGS